MDYTLGPHVNISVSVMFSYRDTVRPSYPGRMNRTVGP